MTDTRSATLSSAAPAQESSESQTRVKGTSMTVRDEVHE